MTESKSLNHQSLFDHSLACRAFNPRRWQDIFSFLLIALAAAWFLYKMVGFGLDDSFITYRYALNLVMGNGPVYNVGERYLGTTAPGFALLLAALYTLSSGLHLAYVISGITRIDPEHIVTVLDIPHLARYVTAISVGAIGLVTYQMFVRAFPNWLGRIIGLIMALWLIMTPQSASVTGHETLPCIALVLFGFYFWSRNLPVASLLFGLATLVRPDAALAFVIAATVTGVGWLRSRRIADARKQLIEMLPFFVPVLAWALFAWYFYGSPIPGTLYTKRVNTTIDVFTAISFNSMTQSVFTMVPEATRWLLAVTALIGFVSALLKRNVFALIGLWGLGYLVAYSLLAVQTAPWYISPLYVVYLLLAGFGTASILEFLWEARHFTDRRFRLELSAAIRPEPGAPRVWEWHLITGRFWRFAPIFFGVALVLFSWCAFTALSPLVRGFDSSKVINQHIYSFDELIAYVRRESPNGAVLATPEPGAVGFELGPKYEIVDTLGLATPGISFHNLIRDFEWAYIYYQPEWIIVTYDGNIQPNLDQPWFKAWYSEVAEFHHPYWTANNMSIHLFHRKFKPQFDANVLKNPNFEEKKNRLDDWSPPNSPMVSVEGQGDDRALQLVHTGTGSDLDVTQSISDLSAPQYLIQFQYRNRFISGDQRVYFQVYDLNDNLLDTFPTGGGYVIPSSADWKEGSFLATIPKAAAKAVIWLRNRGDGEAWFKQVQVLPVNAPSASP